jgi:hypothetical protein
MSQLQAREWMKQLPFLPATPNDDRERKKREIIVGSEEEVGDRNYAGFYYDNSAAVYDNSAAVYTGGRSAYVSQEEEYDKVKGFIKVLMMFTITMF